MRPICDSAELGNFQLSDYTALTSDSADGGPNIRSNKSNAFSDFIVKVCPESVSTCQPRISRFLLFGSDSYFWILGLSKLIQ